ncbi:MAG TPA: hypothetical protein VE465_21315 [Streptosporangiaceae bacterium]|nr:hypothetical protein [Streptosporangiaceae bacterium]
MGQDRNDLREKVSGKAGGLATKATAKAGEKGLSRERVANVKDDVRATGGKAVARSVGGARLVMALALRNKVRMAIASAATAVVAAVAGRRIARRRKSS